MMKHNAITISTDIQAPLEKVWNRFTQPEHIQNWNFATDDWHCPTSASDLQPGGRFVHHMAAKDGSFSFDFSGTYYAIEPLHKIEQTLDDQRKVSIIFSENNGQTTVTETFEPENQNPLEMQTMGWQAILNNFKKYAEQP